MLTSIAPLWTSELLAAHAAALGLHHRPRKPPPSLLQQTLINPPPPRAAQATPCRPVEDSMQTWWPAIVTRLRSDAPEQLQTLPRGPREAHQDCAEGRRQDGRRGDSDEGNSGPPAKTAARLFSDHGEGPRPNQRTIPERAPVTPPRKKANRALPLMEEAALIIVGGIAPRTESGQACVTFCSKPITERQQAKCKS